MVVVVRGDRCMCVQTKGERDYWVTVVVVVELVHVCSRCTLDIVMGAVWLCVCGVWACVCGWVKWDLGGPSAVTQRAHAASTHTSTHTRTQPVLTSTTCTCTSCQVGSTHGMYIHSLHIQHAHVCVHHSVCIVTFTFMRTQQAHTALKKSACTDVA